MRISQKTIKNIQRKILECKKYLQGIEDLTLQQKPNIHFLISLKMFSLVSERCVDELPETPQLTCCGKQYLRKNLRTSAGNFTRRSICLRPPHPFSSQPFLQFEVR